MAAHARRYRVHEVLGRGGFGTVYRADMLGSHGFTKPVALKVLNPEVARMEEVAERLRDEARLLALLHHRAIVRVDGLVTLEGQWAVVMELAMGADLRGILKSEETLPVGIALEIAQEVASALHAAYDRPAGGGEPLRVLHRDIKPSNIQLTWAGEAKVLDFGVARGEFGTREAQTRSYIFGSQGYMAPERLAGSDTHAGDVYSLGVVLYEMLTGTPMGPCCVQSVAHRALLEEVLGHIQDRCSDPELSSLLADCLSLDPERRPTARSLERSLRELRARYSQPWLQEWTEPIVKRLQEERGQQAGPLSGREFVEQPPRFDPSEGEADPGGEPGADPGVEPGAEPGNRPGSDAEADPGGRLESGPRAASPILPEPREPPSPTPGRVRPDPCPVALTVGATAEQSGSSESPALPELSGDSESSSDAVASSHERGPPPGEAPFPLGVPDAPSRSRIPEDERATELTPRPPDGSPLPGARSPRPYHPAALNPSAPTAQGIDTPLPGPDRPGTDPDSSPESGTSPGSAARAAGAPSSGDPGADSPPDIPAPAESPPPGPRPVARDPGPADLTAALDNEPDPAEPAPPDAGPSASRGGARNRSRLFRIREPIDLIDAPPTAIQPAPSNPHSAGTPAPAEAGDPDEAPPTEWVRDPSVEASEPPAEEPASPEDNPSDPPSDEAPPTEFLPHPATTGPAREESPPSSPATGSAEPDPSSLPPGPTATPGPPSSAPGRPARARRRWGPLAWLAAALAVMVGLSFTDPGREGFRLLTDAFRSEPPPPDPPPPVTTDPPTTGPTSTSLEDGEEPSEQDRVVPDSDPSEGTESDSTPLETDAPSPSDPEASPDESVAGPPAEPPGTPPASSRGSSSRLSPTRHVTAPPSTEGPDLLGKGRVEVDAEGFDIEITSVNTGQVWSPQEPLPAGDYLFKGEMSDDPDHPPALVEFRIVSGRVISIRCSTESGTCTTSQTTP